MSDPYLRTCQDCNFKWRDSEWNIYCSDCKHNHRLGFKVVKGERVKLGGD